MSQPKDVFISYSSKDRVIAEALLARLESSSFVCWIAPRDIAPGDSFSGAIIEAISSVKAMVLIFSAESNRSKHCLAEVERAFSAGIPILPFRLEKLLPSPDLEYFLSTSQWLDAFSGSMNHHMEQLVGALRPLVRDPLPGPPSGPVTATAQKALRRRKRVFSAAIVAGTTAIALVTIGSAAWLASSARQRQNTAAASAEITAGFEQDVASARAAAQWAGAPASVPSAFSEAEKIAEALRQAAASKNFSKAKTLAGQSIEAFASAAMEASRKPGLDAAGQRAALRSMIELQRILPPDAPLSEQCAARASELRESTSVSNNLGMRFVYIPAGRFQMGSPPNEEKVASDDDEGLHSRAVDGFYMQDREVTREQFAVFVFETGYKTDAEKNGVAAVRVGTLPPWQDVKFGKGERAYIWRSPLIPQGDNHPVVLVTWNDAMAFCDWLGKREGRRYRLPSEAEWEYACRAGTQSPFYTGPSIAADQANFCDDNSGYPQGNPVSGVFFKTTTPVGSYPPNRFGLYDMHGNVWEWCQDPYAEKYPGMQGEEDSAVQFTGEYVRRGGGWASNPITLRSANRWKLAPDYAREDSGFRVVLADPEASPQ